jgi:hypothetical protein
MYTVYTFYNLIQTYPAWDELRSFLISEEGGYLDIVDDENSDICIIKYNKDTSVFAHEHVRWFRSVVWNKTTNRPVCVAPPRAVPEYGKLSCNESFDEASMNGETIPQKLYRIMLCQKYIDGSMINIFQQQVNAPAEMASRSRIGATGNYHSKRAFHELVEDCLNKQTIDIAEFVHKVRENMHQIRNATDESVFCSFVMQHPDNRIVVKVSEPHMYIVHMGVVQEDGIVMITENDNEWIKPFVELLQQKDMIIPKALEPSPSSETVEDWVQQYSYDMNYIEQGLTMKDGNGGRMKIRTREYTTLKRWRGNTNRDDVRFVQLWKGGELDYYLRHYPEDKDKYAELEKNLKKEIADVYKLYVNVHIQKTIDIERIDKRFRPHLFSLHGMYLQKLRPNGMRIREKDVEMYLKNLPWQRILFLVSRNNEPLFTTSQPMTYANALISSATL